MEITPEIVRELLHYDPETGIFTWRERGEHWFSTKGAHTAWNSRRAGVRAGSVWSDPRQGYQCRQIKILKKLCKEHRLAWLYMAGDPIPDQLDHRDRDGTNNRWDNLRPATPTENSRNRSRRVTSASGVTGVSWRKEAGKWRARCMLDGVYRHLGSFTDINEAAAVVQAFRAKHGFDPAHGAEPAHYHA